MTKTCPICDWPFRDGDDVVAIMVAKFKMIDSAVNYAIEHPSQCIEIVHGECFDYSEYDEDQDDN